MTATQGKKKRPPTFHYLPRDCARRLKKSWVEDRKIRSKWKAQKRREGLTNHTSAPVEHTPDRAHDHKVDVDPTPDTSPNRPDDSPVPIPSLRDLRRLAYASTRSVDSLRPPGAPGRTHTKRGGKPALQCETSQPNMKLRMNVLLEKIRRDLS